MAGIRVCFCALVIFALSACVHGPIRDPKKAMRPGDLRAASLNDQADWDSLNEALKKTIHVLRQKEQETMVFGPVEIAAIEYGERLEEVRAEADDCPIEQKMECFQRLIRTEFQPMQAFGMSRWGPSLLTGYYEPVIEGCAKPIVGCDTPIYQWTELVAEQSKGRSRKDIETQPELTRDWPVLAYLPREKAFFLHIQGSGLIHLKDANRSIAVGYGGHNGHSYVAIGRYLFDQIPREEMSAARIEDHLRSLQPEEARELMQKNPRYIFFRERKGAPVTSFGVEAVAGRSLAIDPTLFPLGALIYYETASTDQKNSVGPSSRFCLAHDTGAGVRGPGHFDLFLGQGKEAAELASPLKDRPHVYFWVPKSTEPSETPAKL